MLNKLAKVSFKSFLLLCKIIITIGTIVAVSKNGIHDSIPLIYFSTFIWFI